MKKKHPYRDSLEEVDHTIILLVRRFIGPFTRLALFVVFFWFGALKVLGTSPANPLVESLLSQTMPSVPFSWFIVGFGLFEMFIGILFLIPRLERIVISLFIFHMITTFLPLLLLPDITWQQAFTPTLEGQYIIKNIVLVALALGIAAHLHPLDEKHTKRRHKAIRK